MRREHFNWAAYGCAFVALVFGGLALCGWIFDIPFLRSLHPNRPEMKANTAVTLMAAGGALAMSIGRRRTMRGFAVALAGFVTLVGGVTFCQYAFDISLRVDELFFKDIPNALATSHPGRMSPQTTVSFMMLGAALLLMDWQTKHFRRPMQWFALASALFPLQLVIAHVYGGNVIMGFGEAAKVSIMALPTTISLLLLSMGTLIARPEAGWMQFVTGETYASKALRRMLLVGLTVPALLGTVILNLLDGQRHAPSYAVSAFAVFVTLAFCALMARHTAALYAAEVSRDRAEVERTKAQQALNVTLADLQKAHELLATRAQSLELAVSERTAALTESNEQLETFVYTMAHDLRAPIRAQQGFASILVEDHAANLNEDGQRAVRRIMDGATRLHKMVEDLLVYARVGKSAWQMEPVSLRAILESATHTLEQEIARTRARVDLPAQDAMVIGHAATLGVCVTNLLSNAFKFVAPGVVPHVRITHETVDGVVRLYVEDNGIGIPEDQRTKLFGIFQRLHAPGAYPGTGIGLALVQRGIERMGGTVSVLSTPEKGSTFCVELPHAATAPSGNSALPAEYAMTPNSQNAAA